MGLSDIVYAISLFFALPNAEKGSDVVKAHNIAHTFARGSVDLVSAIGCIPMDTERTGAEEKEAEMKQQKPFLRREYDVLQTT